MDRKWTYLMFAAGGIVLAFVLLRTGEWAWGYYGARPNDMLLGSIAIGVAGLVTLVFVRNERIFGLAGEVTSELKKVTWPTRRETMSATLVVIITVIVSSLFLGLFDFTWAFLTGRITAN